jgi:hypothetical protein
MLEGMEQVVAGGSTILPDTEGLVRDYEVKKVEVVESNLYWLS